MVDISVIIPIYNAEKYLTRCLDSIIAQKGIQIEIICIDDFSGDGTENILNEYKTKYDNLEVVRNEGNQGAGYSRNTGIRKAKGNYIQFIDADDYLLPDSLAKLYQYARNGNAQICFYKFKMEHTEQVVRRGIEREYMGIYRGNDLARHFVKNHEFFYYACGAIFERSFLTENHILFSNLKIGEGGDFILHSLMLAERVSVSNTVCYCYSNNPESVTNVNKKRSKVLLGQIYQYIEALKRIASGGITGWDSFLEYQYSKIRAGINNLTEKEGKEIEEYFEDEFSSHMAKTLISGMSYPISFAEQQIDKMKHAEKVIVYGAGYLTHDLLQFLSKKQIDIIGIAVTTLKDNPSSLLGHHIYEIAELQKYKDEALVIVSANRKYNLDIERTLKDYGFHDYIFANVDI